jgi:drug/metabolite transporter (DMT)-like permease
MDTAQGQGAGMSRERMAGVVSLVVAVAIWAGWIVLVRATVNRAEAPLGPFDIAALRYGVPAILLAPVWLRCGVLPCAAGPVRVAGMVLGWGAPFALLAATGLQEADSALFAAMVPGSMPFWLSLILIGLTGRLPRRPALVGVGLIAVGGLGALAVAVDDGRSLAGVPWLVGASIGWATYAVAYRGSGLTPVQATAVVAFWSSLGVLPVIFLGSSTLWSLPAPVLLGEALLQGVVSGVVSVMAFALAIRHLGAPKAAAGAASVPVLAALGGWWWLGDPLSPAMLGLLGCTVAGVTLVNATPAT